jgi:hypothetical protein
MGSFQTIKKVVLTPLFLIFTLVGYPVFGQNLVNMTEYLSQLFHQYCDLVPREEVFVSSDREEYIAGEEIWFNVWLIDRQSSRPSSVSKIIYLELLNAENRPVAQKQIKIDKGCGQGQIELPDTLATGTYTIRAYTNWMRNFLPYNCYIKDIKIYNAFISGSFKNKVYVDDKQNPGTVKETSILKANQLLTMQVNNFRTDTLEIFVQADGKILSDNFNLFYLFIQTHGKINHVGSEKITHEHSKISVPKKLLIPGINQITLFDSKGQPVCERYIYTPDRMKQTLSVLSADTVSTRSKVSLELNLDDSMPESLNSTSLCISVTPAAIRNTGMDLNEYMLFGSEFGMLPGKIMKGKKIEEIPREILDSLLMNIKSNWIDWRSVLSDKLPEYKFKVEKEDHYLSGSLLTSDDKPAGSGEFLLLSTPGKVPVFQYTITDNEAKFRFNIPISKEIEDLVIQPDDVSKNYKMNFESSFSDQYLPSEVRLDSISKPFPSYIAKMGLNYQVGKIYGSSYVGTSILIPSLFPMLTKRFYGKPDSEIKMKEWAKLPLMEEVFFEIVPYAKLKKNGSRYEILLADPFGKILYDTPPVMMIDGVIIKNPVLLAILNPEYVEKIDVVKEQYMVGDYLFNGIVNVITKSGNFSNVNVPESATRMQYRIFDPALVFVSPDYSSSDMKNSREPDFRNTLYWNTSVKPDKNGKVKFEFWTSDIPSDYEINIQGITSDGKIMSTRKTIHVK